MWTRPARTGGPGTRTFFIRDAQALFTGKRLSDITIAGVPRIPFLEANGLFQLEIGRGASLFPAQDTIDVAVDGQCFATSGSLKLWHGRMRHVSRSPLLKIHVSGAVHGFKFEGKHDLPCCCDACAHAKICRRATPRVRCEVPSPS